ncbi:LamB/YcsF family protein [Oceanobacillus piezotolerans]|uniref:5-oxoprolinase subunit A n=1 Tax=Oceanobacillus piezotolerans TaxID=2448030 RepID=A0A498DK68_9BACI|nr:5-oxoprolinase subunit PxpA [Oceanobacillus piezotolerans]RLL42825.1 LamB/YcsF family protein [Oceanobacillus piezotolerans]
MTKYYVDLNSDLGESFGAYHIGQDELLMQYITSANIAAGYHAGDHNVLHHSVKMAITNTVNIGAHPGFPDLQGFGRRFLQVDPKEIYNMIVYQVGAVQAFAKLYNHELNHVKPHGALYNIAAQDSERAHAIAQAVYDVNPNLVLFGLAGSELVKAGEKVGLKVAQEVFADRTYQPDGTLTSRTEDNAMIEDADEAVSRVIRMVKDGKVEAVDGTDVDIKADTICVHGDSKQSLAFVRKLKKDLENHGISIKSVGK